MGALPTSIQSPRRRRTVPSRRCRAAPKDLKIAPCRMSVPTAIAGSNLKNRMSIGVISEPPPIPVMPTRIPIRRPAIASRGSWVSGTGDLVDDEHVAAGSAQDVLVDASFHEPLEEPLVAAPDDDQVDVALLRETDDGVRRRALRGNEVSGHAASLEVGPSLLEPLL